MDQVHVPVMLKEVIQYLSPAEGKFYVDATIGAGGHAEALLNHGARILGIEQDGEILKLTEQRLKKFEDRVILVNDNFKNLLNILEQHKIGEVTGILYDLGLSTFQIDSMRGFSFQRDCPLDMRMDNRGVSTAKNLVNEYSEAALSQIIRDYGEERWARGIARSIVRNRPCDTTFQLVEAIRRGIPRGARYPKIHYATRTFQAIRIAVNDELEILDTSLDTAISRLSEGGRIVVISFHSLEDRIVKWSFLEKAKEERLKILTRKPIIPQESELISNPASRSAKMRVAEKICSNFLNCS
ncbi:16S rRNA (cytosine(1402)-N(4))-methyltransferase RsmH [Candidatus Desantisbacteria bacterium]|nr:16S rRNA (cytosine(1402)-N(4))-methyltransferase RsmH [Candidatus Desantisbacteria bacterium]